MNRRQRRAFVKNARKKGISKEAANAYIAVQEMAAANKKIKGDIDEMFNAGDKVTINVEKIKNQMTYRNVTDKYINFIDESAGKVFTIRKTVKKNLYAFEEVDGFIFWGGDLIKVIDQE